MHTNAPKNKLAYENLDLGLPYIIPMLEVTHTLIKYGQRWDVYICEFIDAVKSTNLIELTLILSWFFFVNMMIIFLMGSLSFMNIVLNSCPHLDFTWFWCSYLLVGCDHNQTSQHDYFAKGSWPFF
jgi:hypothetical protein